MSTNLTRIQKIKKTLELTVNTTNKSTNYMDDLHSALKKQNEERIKQGLEPSKTFIFKSILKK